MPELVIVETEQGAEVWPNEGGSSLVATFANRADADLFLAYASKSDDDRIRNAAVNIARAFPVLNLSDAPINPEGELVLRIAQIISADFPARHGDSRHSTATVVVGEGDEDRCTWTLDDSNDGDFWETGCGEVFRFTDGGPTDNKFIFCFKCGKRIDPGKYSDSAEGNQINDLRHL